LKKFSANTYKKAGAIGHWGKQEATDAKKKKKKKQKQNTWGGQRGLRSNSKNRKPKEAGSRTERCQSKVSKRSGANNGGGSFAAPENHQVGTNEEGTQMANGPLGHQERWR